MTENSRALRLRLRYWLPFGVLTLWLVFIAATVWQHTQRSEFPPIHDAFTYFEKAKNFWDHIPGDILFNPFNLPPIFRPPGTVLMSYPFGFSVDYRPFYFRSIFLPVLCLAIAVCAAGYSRRMAARDRWNLICLALLLTALPVFYHFERSAVLRSPGYWGLVDNFLAGVLALAAAACVLALRTLSRKWLAAMLLLASFGLLIKPSAFVLMVLLAVSWFAIMALRLKYPFHSDPDSGLLKRRIFFGFLLAAAIYGSILIVALSTQYMGFVSLAQGAQNIAIMRAESKFVLRDILSLLQVSYGYILPAGAAWIAILAWLQNRQYRFKREPKSDSLDTWLLLAAILCIGVGAWFWLFGSGGLDQVRYFTPFAFVALILVTPLVLRLLGRMKAAGTCAFRFVCVGSILNLGLLLVQADPSTAWQHRTGVSLSIGKFNQVIKQANDLIDTVQAKREPAYVYLLNSPHGDAVFSAVAAYRSLVQSRAAALLMHRPVDWSRPTAVRIAEILESDYILFSPVLDSSQRAALLEGMEVQSAGAESQVFAAWFSGLSAADGITRVSDSPDNRLVRIGDREKLRISLAALRKAHRWRYEFEEANLDQWWSPDQVSEFMRSERDTMRSINFRDLFRVHAVTAKWAAANTSVKFRVWWEPLRESDRFPWFLFIHAVDDSGKIIANTHIELSPKSPEDSQHFVRFSEMLFSVPQFRGIHRIALGIWRPQPQDEKLNADAGDRDWDGRRVLIPIR
jgi:hypothetical protein